jgi:hypothetical protein
MLCALFVVSKNNQEVSAPKFHLIFCQKLTNKKASIMAYKPILQNKWKFIAK